MAEEMTERSKERAAVIMQVRSGLISASEGARRLGVSRKTYYEWEQKGLSALMEALADGAAGRPAALPEDPEMAALRARVVTLEQEITTAKQSETVRRVLELCEQQRLAQHGKKNRSREKS